MISRCAKNCSIVECITRNENPQEIHRKKKNSNEFNLNFIFHEDTRKQKQKNASSEYNIFMRVYPFIYLKVVNKTNIRRYWQLRQFVLGNIRLQFCFKIFDVGVANKEIINIKNGGVNLRWLDVADLTVRFKFSIR